MTLSESGELLKLCRRAAVSEQTHHESIKSGKALVEMTLTVTVKRAGDDTFEITVDNRDYVIVAKEGESFTINIPLELSAA